MANFVSKRCARRVCDKQPSVGVGGTRTVEYYADHKEDGIVNVINKKCGHPGCTTLPSKGVDGSKAVELCGRHAKDGACF